MAKPCMTDSELGALLDELRNTAAMRSKVAIQEPARKCAGVAMTRDNVYALPGDDTAAIRCGDQYQLLAIEGMIPAFVEQAPWFAGWSAVMANVSDITAMGGRATAIVNAYWHHDGEAASQLMAGVHAACAAYGLILAGGHTSQAPDNPAVLAVAVTGWARTLLSTLHVEPGQVIAMAVDLEGQWHGDAPYWKAFEGDSPERLRAKLEVIPRLAEAGVLVAAKDVSNAGILGTLLMLLEPTGCGAEVDISAIPRPANAPLSRWLQVFPSYGFLLTLDRKDLATVQAAFTLEGLECACIGSSNNSGRLTITHGAQTKEFWDLAKHSFTGFTYPQFRHLPQAEVH